METEWHEPTLERVSVRTAHGSSGVEEKDAGRRYPQPHEDRGRTNEEKKYVKSPSKRTSQPTAVGWGPILF